MRASGRLQESAALLGSGEDVKEAVSPCRADVSIDHRPAPAELQPKRQARVDRLVGFVQEQHGIDLRIQG